MDSHLFFPSSLSGERGGDGGDPVRLQLLPGDGVRGGLPGHPALPQTLTRQQLGALRIGKRLSAGQRWASLYTDLSLNRLSRCVISCFLRRRKHRKRHTFRFQLISSRINEFFRGEEALRLHAVTTWKGYLQKFWSPSYYVCSLLSSG